MRILALVLSMLQIAPELITEVLQTVAHAKQPGNAAAAIAAANQITPQK